jgi:hypothetical protein
MGIFYAKIGILPQAHDDRKRDDGERWRILGHPASADIAGPQTTFALAFADRHPLFP